jgi:hypothetical protein
MTKILHQIGFKGNWNLDAYFENGIGDGFIFTAFSIPQDKFDGDISGYKKGQYIPISMVDLQFYGSKDSKGGQLNSYEFHPANTLKNASTQVSTLDNVFKAINFQEEKGFKKIIIPILCSGTGKIADFIEIINKINNKLTKKNGLEYFMTIPFSLSVMRDNDSIEKILIAITDLNIKFDGYYIAHEASLEAGKKVNVEYVRYENLNRIFNVLNKQGYKIIYAYANWDSLIFLSLVNIDYITIGSYEVLRNFSIGRFTEEKSGGPSDGWYFSEKLLNFIRAREIENLRNKNVLDLVKNTDNIFSDIILEEGYPWNTHKPDVHKNYLLSINRLLHELSTKDNIKDRALLMLEKIKGAQDVYKELNEKGVFLLEANSNYHLSLWETFLRQKMK